MWRWGFPNLTISCPQERQPLVKRTPIEQEDTFKDFSMLNRILRKIGGVRPGKGNPNGNGRVRHPNTVTDWLLSRQIQYLRYL